MLLFFAVMWSTALLQPQIAWGDNTDPFLILKGDWRGSGIATLFDKRRYRVLCDASYSGTGSQLVVRIDCKSDYSDLRLRAKVSRSLSRITGFWREEVLGVAGTIIGSTAGNRMNLTVFAAVPAHMDVRSGRHRHKVVITAENVPVRHVEVTMRRR